MYAGFPVLALNSRLTFKWPQILKHSERKDGIAKFGISLEPIKRPMEAD